ncbi:MAG: cobyrinate a,c-diamide synthase [Ignavibacteria bacterium]|nr:cobyrinate a,c-diamide synthase [Ignavibacteria bacterium]MBT8383307.1 cobyrinate a,c-diamide synthase [Ignavibacteria bacterium]MBT8392991.1 cobyrinate a,c-diamide synthase [Ignavibacteria bacterium]NNJ52093.1 cobyrinate a,c-diamide synthase [Ignavibacteriaceae bacterium]NNL22614.1 cobyrinate a,c-diamide synthase [Ignavibacteriaceae bacterium]
MFNKSYPRIVFAGLSGDSGKTVVTCGFAASLKEMGLNVTAFKKGPDYIDAAWLSLVSGKPARNLDTYLMGFPKVKNSFLKNAANGDISLVEGNRGLFDGVDSMGTHSTAELAKLLKAPVIIVQNLTKVTRTAAATILGCTKLDPDLNIAGVILNQVAGERHLKVAKEAIEDATEIPVLGAIPKLKNDYVLPSRHLGLITPDEFTRKHGFISDLRIIIEDNVDIPKVISLANSLPFIDFNENNIEREIDSGGETVRIGYFRDASFSFYYPENLEMLDVAGAELVPISAVDENDLGELDAVYIGGGFPETNLTQLELNRGLMHSLKNLVEEGLPIYAECGGLIYLARDIEWENKSYSLAGILPINIKMKEKPQGHGYYRAVVDSENPFFKVGTQINGHEFHYSEIYDFDEKLNSALSVIRGNGSFNKRDGLTYKNVFASYLHIHALASPEWVDGMMSSARKFKNIKKTKTIIEG